MSDLVATHCDRGVGGANDCGWIIFLILILSAAVVVTILDFSEEETVVV